MVLVEVCVDDPVGALVAARRGAGRIELCADLGCGGVTASAGLMAVANVFMTAVRWWLVCKVMGQPVPVDDALLMSITHSISSILPANGLGMREWLIGMFFGGDAPADFVAISLIDRAAEALVVIPAGLVGLWWLHRQLRKLPGNEAAV